MSALHRHEPELFEDPEAGVCHHSEPWCPRCNPAMGATPPPLDGRYLAAIATAEHARDPIALSTQVKYMRDVAEANGWKPALILVVVDDAHRAEASERIQAALNGDQGDAKEVPSAA